MLILAILLLGLGLRLLNINQSFWLDEAAQLVESSRPLIQQLDIAGDFQPPLFHLLLHFWLYFGKSEVWVRLLPVLLGVLSIWLLYKVALSITSKKIALLASLLFAIAPFHIWYSQEVRPYALSVFLGLLTTHYLLKKHFLGYTLSTILFIYSLYLAPFLLIAHGLIILIFKPKWFIKWLFSITISAVAFLPWFPSFLKQLNIGSSLTVTLPGWSEAVSTPLLKSLPLVFTKFALGRITFDNKIIYAILVTITAIAFALNYFTAFAKNKKRFLIISTILAVPILTSFIVSFFLPILAPQRVLFCLPFFLLLFALGTKTRLTIISFITLIIINSYSLYLYTQPRFQREQWRQAITFIEENRTAGTVALFVFPDAFAPWQWYSRGVVKDIAVAPQFIVSKNQLTSYTSQLQTADRIYYFHYLTDLTDPQKLVPAALLKIGFAETRTLDFPGVGFITIYERALAYH